jgi:hypothetical protein
MVVMMQYTCRVQFCIAVDTGRWRMSKPRLHVAFTKGADVISLFSNMLPHGVDGGGGVTTTILTKQTN